METQKAYKSFRYKTDVVWQSARRGTLSVAGKPDVVVGSPPEFKGEPDNWSPEDLLVGSLNTCLMLTFLVYAQSKGVEPVAYQSSAEGLLESIEGKYRVTEFTVSPSIVLKSEADLNIARQLMLEKVEANCFITNSILAKVKLMPEFHVQPAVS